MGTIVCDVEETPESEEALRVALRLSGAGRMRLVLVHVEDTAPGRNVHRSLQHGWNVLDRVVAAHRTSRPFDTRVEVGEHAAALARVAADEAASMIVVGSPHRRRWRRTTNAALPAVLAATASCPVAVIPPPARK